MRGDLPAELVPAGRFVRRTDDYHLRQLACDRALKRRGGRALEWKHRVGRVELVELDGVAGFAESWVKVAAGVSPQPSRSWLTVRKRIWQVGAEVQVTALVVADEAWWSVCITCVEPAAHALAPWARRLRRDGIASAYPDFLLRVARGRLDA